MLGNNQQVAYGRGQWSSRLTFILAATGSAVGLGNIWKFPYTAAENGGSSFILIYLACIFLIGLPVLCCEVLLGRHGKRNTVSIFRRFRRDYATPLGWSVIGWLGIASGIIILSFYSVIAGWVAAYIFKSAAGAFDNMTAEAIGNIFGALLENPEQLLLWHTAFMVLTATTLAHGVRDGIERVVRYFMPLLLVLLIGLVTYNAFTWDMQSTLAFMFSFEPDKITAGVILRALGMAFFSLSLGMGAMMIYGSYLPGSKPILGTASAIVVADVTVALLAGFAIFPLLFAFDLNPTEGGAGLIFQTLPLAIGQMPGGHVFGFLFFFLLLVAAWTSALSLLEPFVAWCVEHRGWNRSAAAIATSAAVWSLGLLTVLSFNEWEEVTLFDKTMFGLLDYVSSNIMLPVGGFLIVLFAGWVLPASVLRDEIGLRNKTWQKIWQFIVRYLCPVAIVIILVNLLRTAG